MSRLRLYEKNGNGHVEISDKEDVLNIAVGHELKTCTVGVNINEFINLMKHFYIGSGISLPQYRLLKNNVERVEKALEDGNHLAETARVLTEVIKSMYP